MRGQSLKQAGLIGLKLLVMLVLAIIVYTGWRVAASSRYSAPMTAAVNHTKAAVFTPHPCAHNTNGKLLLVSIGRQHLWVCDGTQLVQQSAATTGTTQIIRGVHSSTPVGTWQIVSKQTNRHLSGCDANGCWNDYVRYWLPFDGSIGFHDASWQTFPFGASNYHTKGSHGCVHLPTSFMAWLYNWAPVGTTVTVEA
jgi:hypothetical protein